LSKYKLLYFRCWYPLTAVYLFPLFKDHSHIVRRISYRDETL